MNVNKDVQLEHFQPKLVSLKKSYAKEDASLENTLFWLVSHLAVSVKTAQKENGPIKKVSTAQTVVSHVEADSIQVKLVLQQSHNVETVQVDLNKKTSDRRFVFPVYPVNIKTKKLKQFAKTVQPIGSPAKKNNLHAQKQNAVTLLLVVWCQLKFLQDHF